MKRKDNWWNAYAENVQNIGKNYACITADGRLFSQTEIIGILKSGADKWNSFSESLPPIRWYKRPLQWMPGFLFLIKDASIKDMNLTGYNLSGTNWEKVDFSRCKLQDIQLSSTPFRSTTIFSSCNFYRAEFTGYYNAHFKNCNFQKAELNGFHISRCEFTGNTLKKALVAGRFDKCNIENTDFSESYLSATFININLGTAKGINSSQILWEVSVDYKTLSQSRPMPRAFFKRIGISEAVLNGLETMHEKENKGVGKIFISFATGNKLFAEKLHAELIDCGIDCFFAPHDMPVGAKIRDTLEEKLMEADNVALVLSKESINSSWVEYEIETIYEREKLNNSTILLPIRLDNEVMETNKAWAANLRRTRNIGDFTNWTHSHEFEQAFDRLVLAAKKN